MGQSFEPVSDAAHDVVGVDLEVAINELAADQAALRIILQSFLLRLFVVRADTAPQALEELRDHVLRSIAAIPLADDPDEGSHWRGLVGERAERLFAEIAEAMALPQASAPPH